MSNTSINKKISGFLLIDKPEGISSFGAVYKVRKVLKELTGEKYKVGHSGTLDPAATGLLILAIGKSTKELHKLLKQDKTYDVEMYLGKNSSTEDKEGELVEVSDIIPAKNEVIESINKFYGDILQTPPIYSAIKVNGHRAYKLARKGEQLKMEPRPAKIISISEIKYKYPSVYFTCEVSSGTYIRSLVRDIGEKLGTGAYMSNLRRTAISKYSINEATKVEDISTKSIENVLINLE